MFLRVVTEGGKETLISRLVSGGSCVEVGLVDQPVVSGRRQGSRTRTRMRLLQISRWKQRPLGLHLEGLCFRWFQIGYAIKGAITLWGLKCSHTA